MIGIVVIVTCGIIIQQLGYWQGRLADRERRKRERAKHEAALRSYDNQLQQWRHWANAQEQYRREVYRETPDHAGFRDWYTRTFHEKPKYDA